VSDQRVRIDLRTWIFGLFSMPTKRLVARLIGLLIQPLYSIERKLNIFHKKTIYIEGGLGSQILSIMDFWDLQQEIGIENAKCNLAYFRYPGPPGGSENNGLSIWGWKMDSYGLSREAFLRHENISKKNILIPRALISNSNNRHGAGKWARQRVLHIEKFPIHHIQLRDFFASLPNFDVSKPYGALHIRRGDYLHVASHLVSDETYLDLMAKISYFMPANLLVFSDSKLTADFKTKLDNNLENRIKPLYVDDPQVSEYVVHDAMRMADFLITANSTFSFSAALLGKEGQLRLSPLKFQGGDRNADNSNLYFQSAGNFFIWN
jgi:hypothetical protein